MNTNDMLIQFN